MPRGLRRFQQSGQSHFLTLSCYRRQAKFSSPGACDLFVECLEDMRRRFGMRIYGYVIMPEHVHLLLNEPPQTTLAEAIHFLKLSFAGCPTLFAHCAKGWAMGIIDCSSRSLCE
jgi:putative transposase